MVDIGHEPSLTPPVKKEDPTMVFAHCDVCGETIYIDSTYYDIGGMYICEDCISDARRYS